MRAITLVIAAAGLIASCHQAKAPDPADPNDFRLKIPIAASAGTVQRIDLPASALVAFQRSDRGDVRVFDANDRPLSIARIDDRASRIVTTRLTPIPFAEPTPARSREPVSVMVERGGDRVAIATREADRDSPDSALLFDTRGLSGTATAMRLAADIAGGRPVALTIAASRDLKNWQTIAEPILFRADATAPIIGADRIDLAEIPISKQYLRLRWSGSAAVRISSAILYTIDAPATPRVRVSAKLPMSRDPYLVEFALTGGNRPAAIRLAMTGKDGVLPLRLLGRNANDEPWALLALASLRQGLGDAKFELSDPGYSQYRIEADKRSAGFSKPPAATLEYEPLALLAAFNGNAPYRLAVGNRAATPTVFPQSAITDQQGPFPTVTLDATNTNAPLSVDLIAPTTGPTQRSLWLWLTLLTGVATLALVAWRLMRLNGNNGGSTADPPEPPATG